MTDPANDIERYRNNRMTEAERHALEKKALSDPFLADALEGAESVLPEQFANDVSALKKRMETSRRSTYFMIARIAAGLVLLLTAGWLIWGARESPTGPLAMKAADSTVTVASAVDTSKQLLTLASPKEASREAGKSKAPAVRSGPASPAATQTETITESARAEDVAAEEIAEPLAVDAKDTQKALAAPDQSRTGEGIRDRTVTGKVTEAEDDVPLPGALVRDQKSKKETRTAADGSYSLRVASDTPTIQYSYPGLQTLEQKASGQAPLNIQMKDDASQRSEIIVFATPPADRAAGPQAVAPVGGLEAYQKYLEQNQRIPERAKAAAIHGKVTVSFTVDVDGTLKDFAVVKSLGAGCDEELIRLIREGPAWTPSRSNGKPVPSTVWIKLDF